MELCISLVYSISVCIGSSIICIIPENGLIGCAQVDCKFDEGQVRSLIEGSGKVNVHWIEADVDMVCSEKSLQLCLGGDTVWDSTPVKEYLLNPVPVPLTKGNTVIKTKIAIFQEFIFLDVVFEIFNSWHLQSSICQVISTILLSIKLRIKAIYFGLVISYVKWDDPVKIMATIISRIPIYFIVITAGFGYLFLALMTLAVCIFYGITIIVFACIVYPVLHLLNISVTVLITMVAMFCAGAIAFLFIVFMIFAIHLKLFGFPFIGPIVFNVVTLQQRSLDDNKPKERKSVTW